jgi:lipoprotein-releasing system ATP-binding protein
MLELRSVSKYIEENKYRRHILQNISFKIEDGEFVSLVGKSGSGKSSLLYLMGTLDKPSSGEIFFRGKSIDFKNERLLQGMRKNEIGFVFQFHYLIKEFTALENVLLPSTNEPRKKFLDRANFLLKEMGLEDKLKRKPLQLSRGERQKVAIARSLIRNPSLILADEPTGNLEGNDGLNVLNILKKVNEENKTTIILVTHHEEYAKWGNRSINLKDGMLSS